MIALELGGWLAASAGVVAAAAARRALAGRMETIARACHELRGPLTAVRLGLEGGAGNGMLTSDRLRAIHLELGRAALVLDDLDAVRTRRVWSRPPEPIDLEQLVSDSVEAWARPRPPTGSSSAPPGRATRTVSGDRLRLAQVTGNLIANAIEHGGGVVEVHGHGDRTRARVEVTDSGPGCRRRSLSWCAPAVAAGAGGGGAVEVSPSRPLSPPTRVAGSRWRRQCGARGSCWSCRRGGWWRGRRRRGSGRRGGGGGAVAGGVERVGVGPGGGGAAPEGPGRRACAPGRPRPMYFAAQPPPPPRRAHIRRGGSLSALCERRASRLGDSYMVPGRPGAASAPPRVTKPAPAAASPAPRQFARVARPHAGPAIAL